MDSRTAAAPEPIAFPAAGRVARGLERATLACLVLFVVAAPHSIAATQGAFIAGCVLWVARMVAERRLVFARTAVDVPLAVFVGWTVLTVATSLDPAWSADRLRGVSLFFVLYLFASNVPTRRFAWALALALCVSSVGNLAYTYAERLEGRGVKIAAMGEGSPLAKWAVRPGDTILEADGRPVRTAEELNRAFDGRRRDAVTLRFARGEHEFTTWYRRGRVAKEGAPAGPERLGVETAPGRDFRARALFSHAATYAETLQLVGSVLAGFVIVALSRRERRWAAWLGALALLAAGALVQTQTRAPLAAFAVAVVAMVALRGGSRRRLAAAALVAAVVVAAGAAFVWRGRGVSMASPTDDSTSWRLTVWREALPLVAAHPLLGIGPDAVKHNADELGLFEGGRLPPGHFHSTPIQLAVDRGVPALVAWAAMLAAFFVSAGRLARRLGREEGSGGDWRVTAATLGAWGAVVGFVASSFVHFNWGDSEPMEMAWCLMGLAFAVARLSGPPAEAGELR
jgi:hypothetical protein